MAIPLVLVFLAIPAVGVSGLSLPMPPAVERLAASLVPIGPAYEQSVDLETTAPVRRVEVTLTREEKRAAFSVASVRVGKQARARPETRTPRAAEPSRAESRASVPAPRAAATAPVSVRRSEPRPAAVTTPEATAAAAAVSPPVRPAKHPPRNDRRLVDDGSNGNAGAAKPDAGGPPADPGAGRGGSPEKPQEQPAGGRPEPAPKPEPGPKPEPAPKRLDTTGGDVDPAETTAPEPPTDTHPGNGKGGGLDKKLAVSSTDDGNGNGKGGEGGGGKAPAPITDPAPATSPAGAPATDPIGTTAGEPAVATPIGNGSGNGNGKK